LCPKHTACASLAGKAVAHRNSKRFSGDLGLQLATTAGSGSELHWSAGCVFDASNV
jgi:hypothetical protein